MPKAIVVEDDQLEHAVKVAKVSSAENGVRDAALLLACFGTGMTVTELCLLRVSDYMDVFHKLDPWVESLNNKKIDR